MTPSLNQATERPGSHVSQTRVSQEASPGTEAGPLGSGWHGLLPAVRRRRSNGRSGRQSSHPRALWSSLGYPSFLGHRKVRAEEGEGQREGRACLSPHLQPYGEFLFLGKSSRPTFSHIPEHTCEDHILKPESSSQERKEEGRQGGDRASPGACMCLTRKTSVGYMGRWAASLGADAPWTVAVHVGDTTSMARKGLLACLCTHAFRIIVWWAWKACIQMHSPGAHTFMNMEVGGCGGHVCSHKQGRLCMTLVVSSGYRA